MCELLSTSVHTPHWLNSDLFIGFGLNNNNDNNNIGTDDNCIKHFLCYVKSIKSNVFNIPQHRQ